MRSLPPLDPDLAPDETIAALTPLLHPARCARLDAIAAARLGRVSCVINDLFDPHNYGAVLRSCDAMGLAHVHTINARHRFRVSVKVTQGSERWLEIHPYASSAACAESIRASGARLYAAVPGGSLSLAEVEPDSEGAPIALAFGNEHSGLSPALAAAARATFSIPMHGAAQSLNVSVAVAVALHVVTEARRRRLGRSGDLEPADLLGLRARLYANEVRSVRAVVERYRRDRAAGE